MGTSNESSSDLVLSKKRLTNFHHFFPKWQRLEKIISENNFPDIFKNCFDCLRQGNSKNKELILLSHVLDFTTILRQKLEKLDKNFRKYYNFTK